MSGGDVVVAARCRNCDAPLAGPYCAACGQREVAPNPTFRELAADAWDAVAGFDGKLVASLRLLLTRPGRLTVEHLAGRRARYFAPVKLYLSCSLAFFLLQAVLPENSRSVHVGTQAPTGVTDWRSVDDATAGVTGPEWSRRIQRGTRRAAADGAAFDARVLEQAPRVVFVLVPWHAVLLAAAYRNRRRHLPEHLVFALHGHAFVFCLLAALGLASAFLPSVVHDMADPVAGAALLAYFPLAMRRVYGGRWGATAVRAAAVGAGYLAGVLIVLGVLIGVTYYVMGAPVPRTAPSARAAEPTSGALRRPSP